VVTKIRALLKPKPLAEIRTKSGFLPVKHVVAASCVKISAPKLDNALAGSTIEWSHLRMRSRPCSRN